MNPTPGHPARFATPDGERVSCGLCPHHCSLAAGAVGVCGVRQNVGGTLVTHAWGQVAAAGAEPIEKKGLYHVAPGALAYSFASAGCNLRCRFCQNWLLSQQPRTPGLAVATRPQRPADIVAAAEATNSQVVAATFTEPTIFFEYAYEVASLAREAGLLNVWKTNGSTSPAALDQIAPLLAAVNVDLKSFGDETYQTVMGGRLEPVLNALRHYRAAGVWVEVTTLVIPTINDTLAELGQVSAFIRDELGPATPWHLTRFHPDYHLRHLPPTPIETLRDARDQALALGLRQVYADLGRGGGGHDTHCLRCGRLLVERVQCALARDHRVAGACPACGESMPGR